MVLIGLLTDFGNRDHYVAAMKGVIHNRCDATVIDLSHEIPAYDVFAAAIFLSSIAPWFSAQGQFARRPIFVAVVDPGVGTSRRILAANYNAQTFVAPDNGILSLVLGEGATVHAVEKGSFFLAGGSTTFHGRDRFAPVAAALARGVSPANLGPAVEPDEIVTLDYSRPTYRGNNALGTVISIDRFGNVVTDIRADRLMEPDRVALRVGGWEVSQHSEHYDQRPGEPFVVVGSSGTLEISLSSSSAAERLQISRFDRVEVVPRSTP